MRKLLTILAVALFLSAFGTVAHAHKVKIFAGVEGQAITGYVYFPGGNRAKNVKVQLLGPEKKSLGEAVTNDRGEFTIPAPYRVDYTLSADLGDGHMATFSISADELPDSLPPLPGGPQSAAETKPAEASPAVAANAPTTLSAMDETRFAAIVAREVNRQVMPLREQLDQFEEKTSVHDVIGGLGYIVGLMGIGFYLKGRERRSGGSADSKRDRR